MKKVNGMVTAVLFAVVAGVNAYNAQPTELSLNDLQMENVEALAGAEHYPNSYCVFWPGCYCTSPDGMFIFEGIVVED